MAWYKSGTITVTNGSTTVTGSGTQFISNVAIGEALYAPDGRLYEITNVASDTAFTISPAYLGATAAGQNYVIVPSQSYIRDLAAQAADLVNNYSTIANFAGQGKFGDGTVTEPGVRFSDDLDTGIYRIGSNNLGIAAGGTKVVDVTTSGISVTGTINGTNIPTSSTLAKTTDKLNVFAATTSAELAGVISDETGTGALVFAGSPALTGTPTAPTAAAGTNTTQLATTAHVFAERTNTATLTNKTLTSPTINTPTLSGGTINNTPIGGTTTSTGAFTNLSYTGTLTGSTGVLNIGSGQIYKDASGNVGIGTSSPAFKLDVSADSVFNGIRVGRGAGNVFTNTAVGFGALNANTTGNNNTANGHAALFNNTTGGANTANGLQALYSNTTGNYNTANGHAALFNNTTGNNNTANGHAALFNNTTGNTNTANGHAALYSNTTGNYNTANGHAALFNNTTGNNNTANGHAALFNNTTGSGNFGAAFINSAGAYAPVFDPTTENNRVVMGHTSVTNAYIQVAWTVVSDERDKTNFAPVPHGLDFVNQLNPVAYQFRVNRESEETNGGVRYGFKAQDILALEGENPVIIDTEDEDKLKYNGESLVPVLVNAIKELSAQVEQLKSEIATLKGN